MIRLKINNVIALALLGLLLTFFITIIHLVATLQRFDKYGRVPPHDRPYNSWPRTPKQYLKHTCFNGTSNVTFPTAPNVIIAGAQKCGTMAMMYFLNQHPGAESSSYTTISYYDRSNVFYSADTRKADPAKLCQLQHDYVHKYFHPSDLLRQGLLGVERSPNYFLEKKVPERIAAITGPWKAKIIIMVRDPVARVLSHYRMIYERGQDKRPLEQILNEELDKLRSAGLTNAPNIHNGTHEHFEEALFELPDKKVSVAVDPPDAAETSHLLRRGMYALQLQEWFKYIDPNLVKLVPLESLQSSPQETMDDVMHFLELGPFVYHAEQFQKHISHKVRNRLTTDFDEATLRYLKLFFKPHNEYLSEMIGDNSFEKSWNRIP